MTKTNLGTGKTHDSLLCHIFDFILSYASFDINVTLLHLDGHLTYPSQSELLHFRRWGDLLKGGVADT